uniref:Protein fem-1 homolog B n=1 Tax=Sinohyriopsis schlegelii TaxID=2706150 RepID=A0A075TYJ8_SINSH|nr:feminization-1b [Sinohyriopsis schlegelii]
MAEVSVFELQTLKQKVHMAARDGMAISIFAMLWNLDRDSIVQEVLNHKTEEDGQKTTPLIIAARNGEEKVVQVLLSNFDADIEQTGTVKFDGYVIEGATALWCAAGAGHFGVVRLLVEHGANVNHPTLTNSTPLRAACFDGRHDIVRYLVDHGADISLANKYNNTCLMISCYKGHKDVVTYLLEKGANPDCRAHCGATALHFSCECGHLDIVKELVKFGASMLENDHGMTPLIVASECGRADVVEYLVSQPECSRQQKIDALELLGASYANDKENYDIAKAFTYLKKGMEERFSHEKEIFFKPKCVTVPAYDNRIECQNLRELEAIQRDYDAIHMESLAIRERILGPDNPEVPHPIIFRGAVFADSARFDRCIALWVHAMSLRQKNNRTISKDLLRFSQVFSQMMHLGVSLDFKHVKEVFEHAVLELERDMHRIEKDEEEKDALSEVFQANIHTCLYLLVISLNVNKSKEETEVLHKLGYKFLRLKPALKNGYTPLHMAVDSVTIVDDFHVNDVVMFPNAPLCKMLVSCGADVNALDARHNTPLHVIVRYTNPISDFETLHQILITLIKNGAHHDICNYDCKTPIECATTGVAEVILRTHNQISLKCFAAKAVRKHKIPIKNVVPLFLEEFVLLH